MSSYSGNKATGCMIGVIFAVSILALAVAAQQSSSSLMVNGQQGTAKVVQVQGHNYVDIEGLARLTNGSISFKGSQIVLSLPSVGTPRTSLPRCSRRLVFRRIS